ncbi:FUSC family protein [Frondihabitans australicus]|uniref:Fusaric acid resistance family protein n=1 Tax=Frondihabitans australicus TaxID=386892 RepID=A0A495IKP6_9MICO|nr:FUSC family protein [Frondihabitans australicus]RKR76572.1 fusaric acid resistance family protein [Frondihabitans australicus]
MSTATAPTRTIPVHRSTVAGWRREFLGISPYNRAHWGAFRVAVSLLIPIAALSLSGHAILTIYATFGAMAAMFGRHATYAGRLRLQVVAGLSLSSAVFVGTLVGMVQPGSFLAVAVIALLSVGGFLVARREGLLPVPSLFLVFAAGGVSSFSHSPIDLVWASALPLASAALAVLIGQAGRILPPTGAAKHDLKPRVGWRELLSASGVRLDVARYALGPLVAGGIATALGIGHPYWAALAATVPLQGTSLGAKLGRGTQRFAGTALGLVIAGAVLALNPPLPVLLVIATAGALWAELWVLRNYGLAVIGLTSLALVMVHIASPEAIGTLVADRFVETLIGSVIAVILLIVTSPRRR